MRISALTTEIDKLKSEALVVIKNQRKAEIEVARIGRASRQIRRLMKLQPGWDSGEQSLPLGTLINNVTVILKEIDQTCTASLSNTDNTETIGNVVCTKCSHVFIPLASYQGWYSTRKS